MCCFLLALVIFGPRLAFLIYWITPYGQASINAAFNTFIWPLLGFVFVPWTTLFYALLYPIQSFDWLILGFALFLDIVSWGVGGGRKRIGSYEGY